MAKRVIERSLTVRGLSFLAAGLTSVGAGFLLVERDLVRVGLLVCLVPALGLLYVSRRRHQISVERQVTPPSVAAQERATVTLTLTNSERASALVTAEDRIPYALGERPRFQIPPLGKGEQRRLDYPISPQRRGRYDLGPLNLRLSDPLGLVESTETVSGSTPFIVTPAITPLPDLALDGGRYGAGGETARSYAAGDVSDASIREYRRGDDLRRVHWPTTARMGDLMVRREEQPTQSSATVIIDNRQSVFDTRDTRADATAAFESAVDAAASVLAHLVGVGYHVQLATATGVVSAEGSGRRQDLWPLLSELAVLPLVNTPRWEQDLDAATGSVVVAITGPTQSAPPPWSGINSSRDHRRLAILVGDGADGDWLTKQGWRTSMWAPGTSMADAWQRLVG